MPWFILHAVRSSHFVCSFPRPVTNRPPSESSLSDTRERANKVVAATPSSLARILVIRALRFECRALLDRSVGTVSGGFPGNRVRRFFSVHKRTSGNRARLKSTRGLCKIGLRKIAEPRFPGNIPATVPREPLTTMVAMMRMAASGAPRSIAPCGDRPRCWPRNGGCDGTVAKAAQFVTRTLIHK
jgi:hypothetical protein